MNSFAKHPERTWRTIQENLQPYQQRLANKGIYLSSLIDEIASKIKYDEFNNKPLSGKFLLGFYSQRHALYQKRTNHEERSEEHTSELQSRGHLVCRLLLEKKKI